MSAVVNATLLAEVFITLFVIMDPPGAIPLFLSLTRSLHPRARRPLSARCADLADGSSCTTCRAVRS